MASWKQSPLKPVNMVQALFKLTSSLSSLSAVPSSCVMWWGQWSLHLGTTQRRNTMIKKKKKKPTMVFSESEWWNSPTRQQVELPFKALLITTETLTSSIRKGQLDSLSEFATNCLPLAAKLHTTPMSNCNWQSLCLVYYSGKLTEESDFDKQLTEESHCTFSISGINQSG